MKRFIEWLFHLVISCFFVAGVVLMTKLIWLYVKWVWSWV